MEHVILNEETGAKISIYYHESKQMLPMVVICPGGRISVAVGPGTKASGRSVSQTGISGGCYGI